MINNGYMVKPKLFIMNNFNMNNLSIDKSNESSKSNNEKDNKFLNIIYEWFCKT